MLEADLVMAAMVAFFVPCEPPVRFTDGDEIDVPNPLSETWLEVRRFRGRSWRLSDWDDEAMAGSTTGRSIRPAGRGRLLSP